MAFKLTPVLKNYIWGGTKLKTMFSRKSEGNVAESWEVSVHKDGASTIGDVTLKQFLADSPKAVNAKGEPLPVLIKYIDAKENLSVQVHPGDEFARTEEGENGKTELWYVVQADEGSGIYCGFKNSVSKEQFLKSLQSNTVQELLNFIPVHAGDCFLIRAGTVHTIGAGCVICEIQESSNVTYRIYDYNRVDGFGVPRPLHVEKAMQVINFSAFRDETERGEWQAAQGCAVRLLTQCEYFRCRELRLEGAFSEEAAGSFRALNVLCGCGTIDGLPFSAGDSFFVPYKSVFTVQGKANILITDGETAFRRS